MKSFQVLTMLLAITLSNPVFTQPPPLEIQRLTSNATSPSQMGYSVDIYDDKAVSFQRNGIVGGGEGQISIRERNTMWGETAVITPAMITNAFPVVGYTQIRPIVAINQYYIAVSINAVINGIGLQGAVAVFDATTPSPTALAILHPSIGINNLNLLQPFGEHIALDGKRIISSCPSCTGTSLGNLGGIFVSDGASGFSVIELQNYPVGINSIVGNAVASNNLGKMAFTAILQGPLGDGRVYAYEYDDIVDEYQYVTELQGDPGAYEFGMGLDMICDRLVVGAPFEGNGVGAVYPFVWDGSGSMYTLEPKIIAPAGSGSFFGAEVAVDTDEILVGTMSYELQFGNGMVYSYGRGNFFNPGPLMFSSPVGDDAFGLSMNWDNGTAIIGAPALASAIPDGATYIYYSQQREIFCDLIDDNIITENCIGTNIIANANGTYAIVGHGGESSGDRDMMLSEYDGNNIPTGSLKWGMGLGAESENETAFDIISSPSDYYTIGQTENNNIAGDASDIVISRIDKTTMTPLWSTAYDFTNNDRASKVLDLGNELLVIGHTRIQAGSGWRMMMMKVNTSNGLLNAQISYGISGAINFLARDIVELNRTTINGLRLFAIAGEVTQNGVRRGIILLIDELLNNQGRILLNDVTDGIGFRSITVIDDMLYTSGYLGTGANQEMILAQFTDNLQYLNAWSYGENNITEMGRDIIGVPGQLYVCGFRRTGTWNNPTLEDGTIFKFDIDSNNQLTLASSVQTNLTSIESFTAMDLSTGTNELLLTGGFQDGTNDQETFVINADITSTNTNSIYGCCLAPYTPNAGGISPIFTQAGTMLNINLRGINNDFSYSSDNSRNSLCPETCSSSSNISSNNRAGSVQDYHSNDNDRLKANPLHIYPNPSSGTFTISWEDTEAKTKLIQLYGVSGKQVSLEAWQVFESKEGELDFDCTNLVPGIYFIEIQFENGVIYSDRLVINK